MYGFVLFCAGNNISHSPFFFNCYLFQTPNIYLLVSCSFFLSFNMDLDLQSPELCATIANKENAPAIVGVANQVNTFICFKSKEKVPLECTILYPIYVRGEIRWQPKETPEEKAERINKFFDKHHKNKTKRLMNSWKKDGKIKQISSYFKKK
jgi:hypothetical protein